MSGRQWGDGQVAERQSEPQPQPQQSQSQSKQEQKRQPEAQHTAEAFIQLPLQVTLSPPLWPASR